MKTTVITIFLFSGLAYGQVVNPPGGGGGGATIPSTTNLISGDGAGNGADSGIASANVMTLSGTQTATGAKTFPGATLTDKLFIASSAATTTTSTLGITNNEAGSATMITQRILAPNMGNNNVEYVEIGQAESTNNAFFLSYARNNLGGALNRFSIQPWGNPLSLSIFAGSGDVNLGPATADSGFRLDVQGTLRGQTSITSPAYLTANSFVGRSQTSALNQTIIASATTAMYEISLATNCKTAVSTTSYTATVSYTDSSNTAQSISSGAISCTTLGITSQFNNILVANVLTGTSIILTTSTSGAVSYDVAVTVKQVSAN